MSLVWILAAFLLFSVVIWSAHRLDDYALAHYGCTPFALPNLLLMLIPNALLLLLLGKGAQAGPWLLTTMVAVTLGILLLVRACSNWWIGLCGAALMFCCAPLLLFSVLFRTLAQFPGGDGA